MGSGGSGAGGQGSSRGLQGGAYGGSTNAGVPGMSYGGNNAGMGGGAPPTQANTNYYKAPPGYRVVFRNGEPTLVPTTVAAEKSTAAAANPTTTVRGTK